MIGQDIKSFSPSEIMTAAAVVDALKEWLAGGAGLVLDIKSGDLDPALMAIAAFERDPDTAPGDDPGDVGS